MTARHIHAVTLLSAAILVCAGSAAASAQTLGGSGRLGTQDRYQPGPDSRQMLISTFRSPDKRLATRGTEQFRTEMRAGKISPKDVYLIPREQIEGILTRSNYPADTSLSPQDAKLLASALRIDEYLDATIVQNGDEYQYTGWVYLTRDISLREKLPVPESGEQLRVAAKAFIDAYDAVRKQFEPERACTNFLRDGKFADAESAARRGIAAYPNATIARACLAHALFQQKKPASEVLAVAREILQRDSTNKHGLTYAVESYLALNDTANYVRHALQLVAVDITNTQAVESIVETLAAMRRSGDAVSTIDRAIEASPLESSLHVLGIRLLIAAERWKEVVDRSMGLSRLDSTAVDSAFFARLAVAHQRDSQPEKVAETYAWAVRKFPENASFRRLHGQALGRVGQLPAAVEEYKAALRIDPRLQDVRLFIASGYQQLGEADSSLAWLRQAHTAGENAETISGIALGLGGRFLQAGQQAARDSNYAKSREEYERSFAFLAFSDTVKASDQAKWFWALAAYGIAGPGVATLQSAPTCEVARTVQRYAQVAFEKINEGGGRAGGQTAGEIFGGLQQVIPYAEQMVADQCKGVGQ